MARRRTKGSPSAAVDRILGREAYRLAGEYQLPPLRTLTCLKSLVVSLTPQLTEQPAELIEALQRFPLFLLRDVLAIMPATEALSLVEQGPATLVRRLQLTEYLTNDRTPFYTLEELAQHARSFILFLKKHRDFMIDTGLPPCSFRPSPWLYYHLGRLYDVRATSCSWPHEFSVVLRRRGPDRPPYKWVRTLHPKVMKGSDVVECNYEEADLLKGLAPADATRLERDRSRLFDIKLQVMELLAKAAAARDADGLWDTCLSLLTKSFTAEDVEFFFRMDRYYVGGDARVGLDNDLDPHATPGGLTNMLEVIAHFEEEITVGTLDRTKGAMPRPLLAALHAQADDQLDTRWQYLKVIDHSDRSVLDAALDDLPKRVEAENDFRVAYQHRLREAIHNEFRVLVPITLWAKHVDLLRPLIQEYATHLQELRDRGELLPPGRMPSTKQPIAKFGPIDGLKWEQVTIRFVSNDSVQISAQGRRQRFTFAELGFKDRRKGDRPDTRWEFFHELAKSNGKLSWQDNVETMVKKRAKTAIKDIRNRLKAVFGISINPFASYRKCKGYVTKFTLCDETPKQESGAIEDND